MLRKSRALGSMMLRGMKSKYGCVGGEMQEGHGIGFSRLYAALPSQADTGGSQQSAKVDGYALHPSTMNADMLKAQYAVRGELYYKAQELAAQGRDIIYTNGRVDMRW